jgi:hypothetical protein
MYLTDRELKIWQSAIDYYRNDKAVFGAISQVSDLAKQDFADTIVSLRGKEGYDEKVDHEGFIYARYLLTTYAAQWCKS